MMNNKSRSASGGAGQVMVMLAALAVVLVGAGCGHSDMARNATTAASAQQPRSPEERIASNPAMSPEQKARAIARIKSIREMAQARSLKH